MYLGYCVPCTLVIYNGRGAHQWNVQLKTLIAALFVSPLSQGFAFSRTNSRWEIAVYKHWVDNVRNQYYHYKNLDCSTIFESLYARSEDHVYGSWLLCGYRDHYHFLFHHHLFRNICLHSTRKILG